MFLHLPTDKWPVCIDATPTDRHVSDLLGGTLVRAAVGSSIGMYMREDCRTMPLNVAASYIASRITNYAVPLLGPIVFVGMDLVAAELEIKDGRARVGVFGGEQGLPADVVQGLADMGGDALYAMQDKPELMRGDKPNLLRLKSETIKLLIKLLDEVRDGLPDNFPDSGFQRVELDEPSGIENPRFII